MAPTITPSPPGYAVEFSSAPGGKFAPPSPDNIFIVGCFERGEVAQAASAADLAESFGDRVNYSVAYDAILTALAEGANTATITRVVGPAATAAAVTLMAGDDPAVTVTAKSPGAWGNTLKVQVETTGGARFVVTQSGTPIATSPATSDVQDLVAWSDDQDVVIITAAGATLPDAVIATSLTGGNDDRDHITAADYAAALARLDRRHGPGILLAPGVTDPDVHKLLLGHARDFNRRAYLDLPAGTTQTDAIAHAQSLQADVDDLEEFGGLWATWAYTAPVVGEPARLVPYSAVQAGITSKVYRTAGVGAPPFGVRRGGASTVTKLANEWSDADRHDLYVAGINVAVDDGTTIAPWGFCTLDPQRINQDLHQAFVRMVLKWSAEQLAKAYLGEPVDANTLASYNGRLQLLGKEFVAARAMAAVTVDTDSPNTPVTMAARELHAVMSIQQTPTSDWVDLVIPVAPYTG